MPIAERGLGILVDIAMIVAACSENSRCVTPRARVCPAPWQSRRDQTAALANWVLKGLRPGTKAPARIRRRAARPLKRKHASALDVRDNWSI
jgi:hypothetical protein